MLLLQIEDHEIADVAAVSAGNDYSVGNMIAEALKRVGRKGVVRIENGKCIENSLQIVEGMQFDRGYLSPYFVTDHANMSVEFENSKVFSVLFSLTLCHSAKQVASVTFSMQILLVDKKITNAKEMFKLLGSAVKDKYPLLIIAEGIEEEALAPVIRNKLKGVVKVVAIKAPAFGERKSHCMDDIAILTGGSLMVFEVYA